jgi:hypothetical protein
MRRILGILAMSSLLVLAFAATSLGADTKMKATPFSFDPNNTGDIVAAWQPQVGLADAGGSAHGLVLQKNGPTTDLAAAGATVTGAAGQAANKPFGFDYKNGTYCGGGAPRFNVQASDGFHFLGGCGNATQTPIPGTGWTRVRIDPQNAAQAFPPIDPAATIVSVSVIMDEQGQALLDNILVNGNALIGKPGNN